MKDNGKGEGLIKKFSGPAQAGTVKSGTDQQNAGVKMAPKFGTGESMSKKVNASKSRY